MTQVGSTDKIWVTQEAYERLESELEQLKLQVRTGVVDSTSDAPEFEQQGDRDARIIQLEQMLRRAEVGESPPDDGLVEAGMAVTVRFKGDSDTEQFLLGSREMLTLDSSVGLEVYSPTSPLGSAILGKYAGDSVTYDAPNGRKLTVEIVSATPFVSSGS